MGEQNFCGMAQRLLFHIVFLGVKLRIYYGLHPLQISRELISLHFVFLCMVNVSLPTPIPQLVQLFAYCETHFKQSLGYPKCSSVCCSLVCWQHEVSNLLVSPWSFQEGWEKIFYFQNLWTILDKLCVLKSNYSCNLQNFPSICQIFPPITKISLQIPKFSFKEPPRFPFIPFQDKE